MTAYNVVTLGETMLRLTPPNFQRLEQAVHFEIAVGGSESNTAVGLARLGLKTAWISRLPRSPLGRRVAQTLAGLGVNTSHVVWADEERMGLYFWEDAQPPRQNQVIYDRKASAMSRMRAEELPASLFQPHKAKLLHLTGITPALSQTAADTAWRAVAMAQAAHWQISFDVNFRSKLWSPAAARAGCLPFAQAADLLIMPLRDAQTVFGIAPQLSPEIAIRELAVQFAGKNIVLTMGEAGAIGLAKNGNLCQQPAIPGDGRGRLGGGDAFTAGLLYGFLSLKLSLADGLRWGVAMAALKRTIPGDSPLFEKEEVERLLAAEMPAIDVR